MRDFNTPILVINRFSDTPPRTLIGYVIKNGNIEALNNTIMCTLMDINDS